MRTKVWIARAIVSAALTGTFSSAAMAGLVDAGGGATGLGSWDIRGSINGNSVSNGDDGFLQTVWDSGTLYGWFDGLDFASGTLAGNGLGGSLSTGSFTDLQIIMDLTPAPFDVTMSAKSQIQSVFRFQNTGTDPMQVTVSGYADASGDGNATAAVSAGGVLAYAHVGGSGSYDSDSGSDSGTFILLPGQSHGIGISANTTNFGYARSNSIFEYNDEGGNASASWSVSGGSTVTVPTLSTTFGGGGGGGGSGGWGDSGAWTTPSPGTTYPNASCEYAYLPARSTTASVSLPSGGITLGHIAFAGSGAYTVTGPGALTLACANGVSADVISGQHTISANVNVQNDVTFDVNGSSGASKLTLSGTNTFSSGVNVSKFGSGTLELPTINAANVGIYEGTVKLTSNGASKVSGLTLFGNDNSGFGPGATLNIANKAAGVVVDVASGAEATVLTTSSANGNYVDAIKNAYLASTAWNGKADANKASITSAAISGDSQRRIGYATSAELGSSPFTGVSVDSSAVIMRVVFAGDTDLDTDVDFSDNLRLAQNYGDPGRWFDGDFDYDGTVDYDDLLVLAQNYGGTLLTAGQERELAEVGGESFMTDFALAQSMVPEPATLSLLPLLAVARRRRA